MKAGYNVIKNNAKTERLFVRYCYFRFSVSFSHSHAESWCIMDIETIKTILLVAKTNSFNDAASLVPCSQSSVSRRVDSAETELKIKLFTRPWDSPDHRLHLTEAGEKAVVILQRMLYDYQLLLSLSDDERNAMQTITVGVRSFSMPPMAFSIIKSQIFDLYPNLNLDIQFGNVDHLIGELKNNRLDAVFLCCAKLEADQLRNMDQLRLRYLGKVPMSIGVSERNPLASRSEIRMEELKNELFLLQCETPEQTPIIGVAQMSSFVERIQRQYGYTPRVRPFSENMLEVRYQLAKNGKGIFPSFTPKAWRNMPGVTYIPIAKEEEHYMYYYLLFHSNEHEHELKQYADYLAGCISESEEK